MVNPFLSPFFRKESWYPTQLKFTQSEFKEPESNENGKYTVQNISGDVEKDSTAGNGHVNIAFDSDEKLKMSECFYWSH